MKNPLSLWVSLTLLAATPFLTGCPEKPAEENGAEKENGAENGEENGGETDAGPTQPECALEVQGTLNATGDEVTGTLSGESANPSTTCTTEQGTNGPEHLYALQVTETRLFRFEITSDAELAVAIRSTCDDALTELGCGIFSGAQVVLEPGDYWVLVDTLAFGVGGEYTVALSSEVPAENATCGGAVALSDGVQTDVAFSGVALAEVCPGGPPGASATAFYTIDVPANSLLVVEATGADADGNATFPPDVLIQDGCAGSTCLSLPTGPGIGEFFNDSADVITATIAVVVNEFEAATVSGTVRADLIEPAANLTCAGATTLTPGESEDVFYSPGDEDLSALCIPAQTQGPAFFKVEVPAGETMAATLSGTPEARPVLRMISQCTDTDCVDWEMGSTGGGGPFPGQESVRAQVTWTNEGSAAASVILAASAANDAILPARLRISAAVGNFSLSTSPIPASCDDMADATQHVPETDPGNPGDPNMGFDEFVTQSTALPFAFDHFGVTHNNFQIHSNGFIALSGTLTGGTAPDPNGGPPAWENQPMPTPEEPNSLIAAFWDDLTGLPGDPSPTQLAHKEFTGTDRHLTVEWKSFTFFGGMGTESLTFQAKLFEDGDIEFHYCDMTPANPRTSGAEATVGTEGPVGVFGAQVSHNQGGNTTTGSGWLISDDPPPAIDAGPVPDGGSTGTDSGVAADGGAPGTDGGTTQDGGLVGDAG
jgi:hypothetical protein